MSGEGRGAGLGRQHADQEGLAGLVDDFGLTLTDESMASNQLFLAQAIEEYPAAPVNPAPHVLQGNIGIVRHGLGYHVVWPGPSYQRTAVVS